MLPIFQILADSYDISSKLIDRLLSIQTVDRAGPALNTLTVTLDDRDGMINFPKKGAILKVAIGWEDGELETMGEYIIDEVEISGPPHTLVVRGKPADMAGDTKSMRRHSWENVTVSQIVKDVALRNVWRASCPIETKVERIDQLDESDYNFLKRLGRMYGAVATVRGGELCLLPRGACINAAGGKMPNVIIVPRMLTKYRINFPNRYSVSEVVTQELDKNTGSILKWKARPPIGAKASADAVHVERTVYPDAETAKSAAQAKLNELNSLTANGHLEMNGRTGLAAEKMVELFKFKSGIDGTYLVESVTQNFTMNSWTTTVEISSGNESKANKGEVQPVTKMSFEVRPTPYGGGECKKGEKSGTKSEGD